MSTGHDEVPSRLPLFAPIREVPHQDVAPERVRGRFPFLCWLLVSCSAGILFILCIHYICLSNSKAVFKTSTRFLVYII